jgi:hypothetical protein
MTMNQKQPRATHVNVYFRPKAKDISIQPHDEQSKTATAFDVNDAKSIYQFMVQKAKELKTKVHVYQPDPKGTTPVVKFNAIDNRPYMALLPDEDIAKAKRTTKVVF